MLLRQPNFVIPLFGQENIYAVQRVHASLNVSALLLGDIKKGRPFAGLPLLLIMRVRLFIECGHSGKHFSFEVFKQRATTGGNVTYVVIESELVYCRR